MDNPDFIVIHENAVSRETCAAIVARFEADGGATPGRIGSGVFPELKDSSDITLEGKPQWQDVQDLLMTAAFNATLDYLRRYPYMVLAPLMLQTGEPRRRLEARDIVAMDDAALSGLLRAVLRPGSINLQRYTADKGGYPYWHCETYPRDTGCETLHRHLLWTLYLNDGFDEGETEFLYQQRKITPRTGSLLVAPAAFTHTHRGNRPRGGDKYIATSWILFQRAEQLFPPAQPQSR
ncbi:MAG: 2OG-Fe(II) oxygenase [Xanthomonadales bacterium]|nr:2OG-Fe(II) oxygenase [Xanthomonadales bacterium]